TREGQFAMRQFHAGTHDVFSLTFSPDASTLAAAVLHDGIFLWNLADSTPTPKLLELKDKIFNRDFVFEPDGHLSWISTSGRFGYDPDSDKVPATPLGNAGAINTQILLTGGQLLTGHGYERMGVGLWWEGRGWDWDNAWFFDFRGSFHALAA